MSVQPSSGLQRPEVLEQIYEAVLSRFPLLRLLHFSHRPDVDATQLPSFIGLIAALFQSGGKPCCVVLPDTSEVTLAVSALIAVTRLCHDFPEILRSHASDQFRRGEDHVLVHPCELVYRYDGLFTADLFKLKVIDRNEWRSLPITEIARLEKTTRKRPKGQLDSDLGLSLPTVLGSILKIKIPLNRNFLRNYVLVLGARKHFLEALDRWTVEAPTLNNGLKGFLKDEIPFGKVREGGNLSFLDDYVAAGQPLVAIAPRADDLAACCSAAPKFTRDVLVDDIDYLTRDFRAYDTISDNQNTVIIASDSQRDSVRQLEERGCEIWRLTPDEILFGLNGEGYKLPVGNVVAKARRSRGLVISGLPCDEEHLNRAAQQLHAVAQATSVEENGAIRELLYSLYRVLLLCAQYIGQSADNFARSANNLLQIAERDSANAKAWLTPAASAQVKDALDNIRAAVCGLSQCNVTPKGELLLRTLQLAGGSPTAVVVRQGETNCEELREWIGRSGSQADIYSLGTLPENQPFGRILVVSWPGAVRFDRLVHQYLTDDLKLLAYAFEEDWLNRYRQSYKRSALAPMPQNRILQRFGLSLPSSVEDEHSETEPRRHELVKFDLPSERFLTRRKMGIDRALADEGEKEDFVEAYYVDFVGPTFSYLTDGHELPVINTYISGQQSAPGKIPLRSVQNLTEGDYLMFRESGDTDIIRFLAEDEIGKDKYGQLRVTAGRWRITLEKLGRDPKQVLERLRPFGFSRHIQTLRAWLSDQNTICPQDITDVRIIAGAAHDKALFDSLPDIERARDELTSLHIRAGHRLTELLLKDLPKKITFVSQGETELDLGVGKVWVVRVEEIDHSPSLQRRSQLNRLLWDVSSV